MRLFILAVAAVVCSMSPAKRATESIATNDNRASAGTLKNGVLTIPLEAREGEWHPDRAADPGIVLRAFGERGKPLLVYFSYAPDSAQRFAWLTRIRWGRLGERIE